LHYSLKRGQESRSFVSSKEEKFLYSLKKDTRKPAEGSSIRHRGFLAKDRRKKELTVLVKKRPLTLIKFSLQVRFKGKKTFSLGGRLPPVEKKRNSKP